MRSFVITFLVLASVVSCKNSLDVSPSFVMPSFGGSTPSGLVENGAIDFPLFDPDSDLTDVSELTFTCTYDQVLDGAVNSGANCSGLGIVIDSEGNFQWTPSYTQAGSYEFKVVIDHAPSGQESEKIFTLTIADVNAPPLLDAISDITVNENVAITPVDAGDGSDDFDIDSEAITYTCFYDQVVDGSVASVTACSSLPGAVSFVGVTGVLSWTPDYSAAGVYEISIIGDDSTLTDDEIFVITVNDVNFAPVLDAIADETVAENVAVTAVDAGDGGDDLDFDLDTITYTCIYETTINGTKDSAVGNCTALPGTATFNTTTGVFNWTPNYFASGTYEVWINGSDGSLNDDELIEYTITNVNRAPVLDAIGNETVAEASAITQVDAADGADDFDIDNETITYTCIYELNINGTKDAAAGNCTALPGTATFVAATGVLNWTPDYSASGTYEVWINGSDGSLSDDELIVYTITNTDAPPSIDTIADTNTNEGVALSPAVDADDNGDDLDFDLDVITYACTYDVNVDASVTGPTLCSSLTGASFNTSTGILNWTPDQQAYDNGDVGRYEFKIVASSSGGTDEEIFVITANKIDVAPSLASQSDETVTVNNVITSVDNNDGGDDEDIDGDTITYACTYDNTDNDTVDATNSCNLNGFSFNTTTGVLSGTPTAVNTYEFYITGQDPGTNSDSIFFTITVNPTCMWKTGPEYIHAPMDNSCYEEIGSNIVNDVVVSGSNIYLATNNGLSISTDSGATFATKTTTDGLGSNLINGVYLYSGNIYVATSQGVSYSTDSGVSFTNRTTADGLGSDNVQGIAANASGIFAATDSGVAVSTDAGLSFTNRTTGDGLGSDDVSDIFIEPGGVIFACTNNGLSISSNGGTSFSNKTTIDGLPSNIVQGASTYYGSNLWVATTGGLSYSSDGGATFSATRTISDGLGSNNVRDVFFNEGGAGQIFAATSSGLSVSTDGGTSFTNQTTVSGLGNNSTTSTFFASGTTLYVGTFGGISYSSNGGTSFLNIATSTNLGSSSIRKVDVDASNNIYVSTNSGLSISTDGGATFSTKTTSEGLGNNDVYGSDVDSSGNIYVATTNGLGKSTNGGTSFINITGGGLGSTNLEAVFVDGSDNVYVATDAGLSISTDGGASFVNRTTAQGLGSNNLEDVHVDGVNVYVATDSGIAVSTDSGASFTNYDNTDGLGDDQVHEIFVVGTNVYAATDAGFSISTDSGLSYTNYTTGDGLANDVTRDVFAVGTTVYIATNGGLSITTDGGSSFTNKDPTDGIPSFLATSVFVDSLGAIWVGTFDNGLSVDRP